MAVPFGRFQIFQSILACLALLATAVAKFVYWRSIDNIPRSHTTGDATGLGKDVRLWELPHTNVNFIQKEMGYVVARKHATRLRWLVFVLLGLAIMAMLLAAFVLPVLAFVATIAALAAATVERWLFFAEAEHVVNLYYGKGAV